jgi:hypothetical protein
VGYANSGRVAGSWIGGADDVRVRLDGFTAMRGAIPTGLRAAATVVTP